MLKFDIITVLPQIVTPHFEHLPFKRALQKNLVEINVVNLREFALDKYGTVDDKPYGGGVGMVLMVEPIYKALVSLYPNMVDVDLEDWLSIYKEKYKNNKIILMDPKGKRFVQQDSKDYMNLERLTFICGRYEGVDERVSEFLATDCVSIGDFVLSGGELPAVTIMESVTRLIPGAIEKDEATQEESFSGVTAELEYPQYTRPEDFKGAKVPEILLSGHHKNITTWRDKQRKK